MAEYNQDKLDELVNAVKGNFGCIEIPCSKCALYSPFGCIKVIILISGRDK